MAQRSSSQFHPLESRQLLSAAPAVHEANLLAQAIYGDRQSASQNAQASNDHDERFRVDHAALDQNVAMLRAALAALADQLQQYNAVLDGAGPASAPDPSTPPQAPPQAPAQIPSPTPSQAPSQTPVQTPAPSPFSSVSVSQNNG